MGEPIKIIVMQGGTGGEALGSTFSPKGKNTAFGTESEKIKPGFTKREQAALAGLVLASSRKTIMNSINNTLAMTGNYMETTKINDVIQMATKISGIGIAGVGIATAVSAGLIGPVGAALAATAIVVNQGIQIGQQIKQFNIQVSKVNYQAERARIRAGTSLGNGSRGTNE